MVFRMRKDNLKAISSPHPLCLILTAEKAKGRRHWLTTAVPQGCTGKGRLVGSRDIFLWVSRAIDTKQECSYKANFLCEGQIQFGDHFITLGSQRRVHGRWG
jgi:hypothetical protein